MATPALAASLAQLTGLDVATAQEQLLPHLDSLKSSGEVKNYLSSLLAPGPAAQTFISLYTAYRFPTVASSSAPPSSSSSRAGGSSSWAAQPASNRNASPSSSHPSSRAASPASGRMTREKNLDRAVKTAPKGGKVYIKEREDQLDQQWGAAAGKSTSRSSSTQRHSALPPPVPTTQPVLSPATSSQQRSTSAPNKGKGKAVQVPLSEAETEISEEGAVELLRIEKALRGFQTRREEQRRACFCQARQHPLATYAPLCPRCSLVLCTINLPSAPCPSCSHSPLLSSAATATHIASLQSEREALLAKEKRRVQLAKEQEERERAAIRFPDLGAENVRAPLPGGGRTYAGHAGGGSGVTERIERAYEARAAQLAAAKGGASNGHALTGSRSGRVLRLDGKTGKVKVQTKVVKAAAPSDGKGKGTSVTEETTAVMDADDDDGLIPWIDENDDGVRGKPTLLSVEGQAVAQRQPPKGRPFANVTLPEDEWPVYIAIDNATTRLDDDNDSTGASKPNGGSGANQSGRAVPAAGAASTSTLALAGRALVPGAAVPVDDAKSKRRRGKGGKGTKADESVAAAATE